MCQQSQLHIDVSRNANCPGRYQSDRGELGANFIWAYLTHAVVPSAQTFLACNITASTAGIVEPPPDSLLPYSIPIQLRPMSTFNSCVVILVDDVMEDSKTNISFQCLSTKATAAYASA